MTDVPANHVRHDGVHHPVNAHWHAANTDPWPHLAASTRQELRDIQDELLLKSNDTLLSKDELAYLKAANNHFDVRTCINLLGGRDHRDFDFAGVDQLHFNSHTHECGCKLQTVFDHHKAREPGPDLTPRPIWKFIPGFVRRVLKLFGLRPGENVPPQERLAVHPHAPLAVCDDHAPHAHDLALLHERVAADNRPPEG